MAGKTRKSITKRLIITRRGKMVRRPIGQNHFLSKWSGRVKRRLHGRSLLSQTEKKAVVRQLHY
jgi:ribosomal protein L35